MNLCQTVWRCTVIFLLNFKCALLLVGHPSIECQGNLTVEPAPLFRMGTNLTVYCHTTCIRNSQLYLQLQVENQRPEPEKRGSCTTARFRWANFRSPNSKLVCTRKKNGIVDFICGLDLQSGFPPDKPTEISCQTIQSSNRIYCFWTRGQETHLDTTYNISVTRNGTQIHYNTTMQSTDNFSLPKTLLDENEMYQLTITAANDLGKSNSEPFILRVRDVVVLPDVPEIQNVQIEIMNDSIIAVLHWKPLEPSEYLMCHTRLRTLPKNGSWVLREQTRGLGLIRVRGLDPLTEYEFQIRVCKATPELIPAMRPTYTSTPRPLCSTWSLPVRAKSPAKESPVTVSGSERRHQLTSPGEGPPGNMISLQPVDSEVGWWMAGLVVTGALFMIIVANLMCWSCLRNRVKKMCISVGPAWLVETVPKLGNSNAIKLMQEKLNTELFWSSLTFTYSDPVMSSIEEISQEEQEEQQYPTVHTLGHRRRSGQAAVDGTLQEMDDGNMPGGYKPQITTSDLQDHTGDKELRGVTTAYEQGEGSLGLTLDFMSGCLGSNTPRISGLLFSDREDRLGKSGTESKVKMDTVCLDVQESETLLHETQSCLSQGMVETTMTNGYFPQRYCQQHPVHIEG